MTMLLPSTSNLLGSKAAVSNVALYLSVDKASVCSNSETDSDSRCLSKCHRLGSPSPLSVYTLALGQARSLRENSSRIYITLYPLSFIRMFLLEISHFHNLYHPTYFDLNDARISFYIIIFLRPCTFKAPFERYFGSTVDT